MRVEATVFRRGGVIVVETSSKALDGEWHLNTRLITLPADIDDARLGGAILDALREAGSCQPATQTAADEQRAYFRQRDEAVGAHGDADFARGCEAVSFLWYDDDFTMTPLVFSASGGYGAWGGRQPVPTDIGAAQLGALCRDGLARPGVPSPAEGIPSHS